MEVGEVSLTPQEVLTLGHRGGSWEKEETPQKSKEAQNSFGRAIESLKRGQGRLAGWEIDVRLTKDGYPVVTHENVSNLTLEEFKETHPDHGTLEGWFKWLEENEQLKETMVYLDLKDQNIDPFFLIEMITKFPSLEGRVIIGAKNPQTVVKLLLARQILCQNPEEISIFLQIPDPFYERAVDYAKNLLRNAGVNLEKYSEEEKSLLEKLKPDGLHFFFPENILKDLVAEILGHGAFIPLSEKVEGHFEGHWKFFRFPNLPLFHTLQRERLKRFVREAIKEGYKVIAGSATSRIINELMIKWGVMAIMPNIPDYLPLTLNQKPILSSPNEVKLPENPYLDSSGSLKEKSKKELEEELKNLAQNSLRKKYLEIVLKMGKPVNILRQQIGI